MNTTKGALSLDEALAQLREHYEGKRDTEAPGSGETDAALGALSSLEWHVTHGGLSLKEALTQLLKHFARKIRDAAGNRVEITRLCAAWDALDAVEWHAGKP